MRLLLLSLISCIVLPIQLYAISVEYIDNGMTLQQIDKNIDIILIFKEGVEATNVEGDISLLGRITLLSMNNTNVYGNMTLGTIGTTTNVHVTTKDTFIKGSLSIDAITSSWNAYNTVINNFVLVQGEYTTIHATNTFIKDGLSINAKNATFTGEQFIINDAINIWAEDSNNITLRDAVVFGSISIGSSTSNNTISLINTRLKGSLYTDGYENTIAIHNSTIEGDMYIGGQLTKSNMALSNTTINAELVIEGRENKLSLYNTVLNDALILEGEKNRLQLIENITTKNQQAIEIGTTQTVENTILLQNTTLQAQLDIMGMKNILVLERMNLENTISLLNTNALNDITINNTTLNHELIVKGKESSLVVDSTTINSPLVLASNNNIAYIQQGSTFSNVLYIFGDSTLYIDTPSDLSFINYNPQGNHRLVLTSGFQYLGKELIIPLPQTATSTLDIKGASIIADIYIPQINKLCIDWKSSLFIGTMYTEYHTRRGQGYANDTIIATTILPEDHILGLQYNTTWIGDLRAKKGQIGILESSVQGSVVLQESNLYLRNALITGSMILFDTDVEMDNLELHADFISNQDIYINGGIYYTKQIAQEYDFIAKTLQVTPRAGPLFSTQNGNVRDKLTVITQNINTSGKPLFLFAGDADFSALQADSIRLEVGQQSNYIIQYTTEVTEVYNEVRRIEHVLQNFENKPILYNNTMSGYDIALVQNEHTQGNYDLILLGYSKSNDAFATNIFTQQWHSDALHTAVQSQVLQSLDILTDEKKATQGFSLWTSSSILYKSHKEEHLASLQAQLYTTTLGTRSAPLTLGNATTIIEAFVQFGYTNADIHDIATNKSSSTTNSITAYTLSTWNIPITPNQSYFLSFGFGAGMYFNTVTRPHANAIDSWKNFLLQSSLHTGYRVALNNFSIAPYLTLNYSYFSDYSFRAQDNTHIESKASSRLLPRAGLMVDYTIAGFRPYLNTTFSFPIHEQTLAIQYKQHAYTSTTPYTTTTLGLEYTHAFSYVQLSLNAELGLDTTLQSNTETTPHATFALGIAF